MVRIEQRRLKILFIILHSVCLALLTRALSPALVYRPAPRKLRRRASQPRSSSSERRTRTTMLVMNLNVQKIWEGRPSSSIRSNSEVCHPPQSQQHNRDRVNRVHRQGDYGCSILTPCRVLIRGRQWSK